jgi:pimeloyl-ACP methyl ester carboxylesterase
VENGSFEEPRIAQNTFALFTSIPGWQLSFGFSCGIEIQSGIAGTPQHGSQFVELDSLCSSGISQDLPTTPGQVYELHFFFSARPISIGAPGGVADNHVIVKWDGSVIADLTASGVGLPDTVWTEYAYRVTASSTTTRLEFDDASVSDAFGTYIDNVRVVAVGSPPPPPPAPLLGVTGGPLDFGPATVGTSKDLPFTVQNTGGGTLTGTASTSTPFSIVSGSPFSLGADQSQIVTVRFNPDSAEPFTGNVGLVSNVGGGSVAALGQGILRPAFPVVFVHGICSSSVTWSAPGLVQSALTGIGWTFGGTLRPFSNDLAAHLADADFYLIDFLDPLIRNGLTTWGTEFKRYLDMIKAFRAAHSAPNLPFIIVAHSAGGLAVRTYLQSLLLVSPFNNDVTHLITYGTPHLGTDTASWWGRYIFLLPGKECAGLTFDDAIVQLKSSQGVQEMLPDSPFLHNLNDQLFPAGVLHTSLIGLSNNLGCVALIPLIGANDCVVPSQSQDILHIHAPPPTNLVETLVTDRRHDFETADTTNILWAIDRTAIYGVDRLVVNVASPVEIAITDPFGRSISKTSNNIPFASYEEISGENADHHDTVIIPFAVKGDYRVKVLAEPGALPNATFTITAKRNSVTSVLAENVPVAAIPAEPYIVRIARNIQAGIDIKPGDTSNSVNLRSRGRIPVAILSTLDFDAPNVVRKDSLTFGHTGNEASLVFCNWNGEDVNGDGLPDLVCHFAAELTRFAPGDTEGLLKGETVQGTLLSGMDSIRIVPK